ncbi:MAG: hypothetical protein OEO77_02285 [Acidimicrobiia bacterium]|nr:hypothetical protein [Acidimicrobiia bacterium]
MNKSHKVRATRQHQEHAKGASPRSGKPYKGENFIQPKTENAKKNAGRAAAARKTTKQ